MKNLDIATNQLKTIDKLNGFFINRLGKETILELAKNDTIPHYAFSHPITKEVTYFFDSTEVNKWIRTNALRYNSANFDQTLIFNEKNNSLLINDNRPSELSNVKNLYKIPFSVLNLPCGVYFLYLKSELVYIGQSVNPCSRITQHLDNKIFDDIYFIPCPKNKLSDIEFALIHFYKPKYNNGGRKILDATEKEKNYVNEILNLVN